jgi:nicotinate-nucleotide adenylyltransferase
MIGFLGGSFDPVHYGHLHHAQAIKQELGLTQLFLLPCYEPVHKKSLTFSNEQRLKMLKLALLEFKDLSISTLELDKKSSAYTIDTLKQLKQDFPNQTLFFIMGADNFKTLHTWKAHKNLKNYAKLVVLPRGDEPTNLNSPVYFSKTSRLDISSTQIRSKIRNHQNLSNLLPQSIIHYLNTL